MWHLSRVGEELTILKRRSGKFFPCDHARNLCVLTSFILLDGEREANRVEASIVRGCDIVRRGRRACRLQTALLMEMAFITKYV